MEEEIEANFDEGQQGQDHEKDRNNNQLDIIDNVV